MTEMEDTMINIHEVLETNDMIEKENLDVRTITLGISLLSCCDNDLDRLIDKIYNRITTVAKDLGRNRKGNRERVWYSNCK